MSILPTIRGVIDRRILVNFRVKADVLQAALPAPFRVQRMGDWGIGGICLIRFKDLRPAGMPKVVGLSSENGAHRIAVEWDDAGELRTGVYVPRRDTDSCLTAMAGGRLFPGVHHHAVFNVDESGDRYSVTMTAKDDGNQVHVVGSIADSWPSSSIFTSIEEASEFFRTGNVGYSDARSSGCYDGMELQCDQWEVEAMGVSSVSSSYFQDLSRFPSGTVEFDNALLMRNIDHEWHGLASLKQNPG